MPKQVIDLNVFAQRLSLLLKDSPETIYTLAEKLSLSAPTISRYANAQMAPKVPTVFAIANIFRVNPQWLMGYDVDMETNSAFKNRLSFAMNLRSIKAVDLAQRTDIPKSSISQYLSGMVVPKSDRTYLIAQALNVDPVWLMGYDVDMETKESLPLTEREQQADELLTQLLSDLSLEELQRVADFVAGLKAQR